MEKSSKQAPIDAKVTIDGAVYPLRLTLGALAELEQSLGGGNFDGLKTRLTAPRVVDLILILQALIAGGGAQLTLEALKASALDFKEVSKAIATAFSVFADPETEEKTKHPEANGEAPGKH